MGLPVTCQFFSNSCFPYSAIHRVASNSARSLQILHVHLSHVLTIECVLNNRMRVKFPQSSQECGKFYTHKKTFMRKFPPFMLTSSIQHNRFNSIARKPVHKQRQLSTWQNVLLLKGSRVVLQRRPSQGNLCTGSFLTTTDSHEDPHRLYLLLCSCTQYGSYGHKRILKTTWMGKV